MDLKQAIVNTLDSEMCSATVEKRFSVAKSTVYYMMGK